MRNLTELLQEIPLDEMTGGLDMNIVAEDNEKTITQTKGARIRSKRPAAAAAIAACAALAVFGGMHYVNNNNSFIPHGQDESIVTDAEDLSDEIPEEGTEAYTNYILTKKYYEKMGADYDMIKSRIVLMQDKVGEITEGFENYDIRVINTNSGACGADGRKMLSIDVAISTKDGSNIELPVEGTDNKLRIATSVTVDGQVIVGSSSTYVISADDTTAVGTITIDADMPGIYSITPDSDIELVITSIYSGDMNSAPDFKPDYISTGKFKAKFKAGDVFSAETPVYNAQREYNYELAKLFFDENNINITQMDHLRIMESKVGGAIEGFDNYDLRVPAEWISGNEYYILIEVNTLDGSEICPRFEGYSYDIEAQYDVFINNMRYAAETGLQMRSYGDKAIGCITVDLTKGLCDDWGAPLDDGVTAGDILNADTEIDIGITQISSADVLDRENEACALDARGEFAAIFKVGDIFSEMNISESNNDNMPKAERFARMLYEANGKDYELAKNNVVLMDDKVGEIKEGFEDFDIRVSDLRACYPFYKIDIAVQKKDGSALGADGQLEYSSLDLFAAGKQLSDSVSIEKTVGKDKAVFTVGLDITTLDDPDEVNDLLLILDGLSESDKVYDGRFEASISVDEIMEKHDTSFPEYTSVADENGEWEINRGADTEPEYLDYSVRGLGLTNCEVLFDIYGSEDRAKLKEGLTKALNDQLNSESANDFITMEYSDGTVEAVPYSEFAIIDVNDGQGAGYMVILNCLNDPFDASNVKAAHLGSAVIPIEEYLR